MILAELTGGIAMRLEHLSQCRILFLEVELRAGQADFGQTGTVGTALKIAPFSSIIGWAQTMTPLLLIVALTTYRDYRTNAVKANRPLMSV